MLWGKDKNYRTSELQQKETACNTLIKTGEQESFIDNVFLTISDAFNIFIKGLKVVFESLIKFLS